MYWYKSFLSKDHTNIYMNIVDFLNTYDIEKQTFNEEIKQYEDPMNLSPRSQEKRDSALVKFLSLFVKF
jgi:hypothetical protein